MFPLRTKLIASAEPVQKPTIVIVHVLGVFQELGYWQPFGYDMQVVAAFPQLTSS